MRIRSLLASLALSGALLGAVASGAAAAQSEHAATQTAECEDGTGQLTVTVRGEEKVTKTVPNERSRGLGPCSAPHRP